jgi:hypothetical protein
MMRIRTPAIVEAVGYTAETQNVNTHPSIQLPSVDTQTEPDTDIWGSGDKFSMCNYCSCLRQQVLSKKLCFSTFYKLQNILCTMNKQNFDANVCYFLLVFKSFNHEQLP